MGNGMDKIIPGVYVGSIRDSKDTVQLKENNITHVLAIHDNAARIHPEMEYLCIIARDCATQDLNQFFTESNDFIHKARQKGGNVLIHCLAGVSRSVTVAVVYIMTVTNLGWRDALNAVRGARRCANPNFGFQRQLVAFEHEKLQEERRRLLRTLGPSPYNDLEYCRQQLNIHRQWVLHGDSAGKDEDRDTYPLPHKAYGDRERAKKAEGEVPCAAAQSRPVDRVTKTALVFKDAETKRPAWDRKGAAKFIVTDNDCDKTTLEAYCHQREEDKERERRKDREGVPGPSGSPANSHRVPLGVPGPCGSPANGHGVPLGAPGPSGSPANGHGVPLGVPGPSGSPATSHGVPLGVPVASGSPANGHGVPLGVPGPSGSPANGHGVPLGVPGPSGSPATSHGVPLGVPGPCGSPANGHGVPLGVPGPSGSPANGHGVPLGVPGPCGSPANGHGVPLGVPGPSGSPANGHGVPLGVPGPSGSPANGHGVPLGVPGPCGSPANGHGVPLGAPGPSGSPATSHGVPLGVPGPSGSPATSHGVPLGVPGPSGSPANGHGVPLGVPGPSGSPANGHGVPLGVSPSDTSSQSTKPDDTIKVDTVLNNS